MPRLAARLLSRAAASRVRLLSAADTAALHVRSAREVVVPVPRGSSEVAHLELFVVRGGDGSVRAFENHCPHAGGPLNMLPDRFFARDGEHLLCTRHAAMFSPDSGACVRGPCVGEALNALPVEVTSEGVTTSLGALQALCDKGGGAFVLRPSVGEGSLAEARPGPPEHRKMAPRRRRRRLLPNEAAAAAAGGAAPTRETPPPQRPEQKGLDR